MWREPAIIGTAIPPVTHPGQRGYQRIPTEGTVHTCTQVCSRKPGQPAPWPTPPHQEGCPLPCSSVDL